MAIISLITDFGLQDNFVGVIKAVILKINPQVTLVDICHGIKPQNILEAAFLLRSAFSFFPKNTVHLVVVDPGVGTERRKILIKTKNYFFIAPDNGVLSLALKEEPLLKIIEITNDRYFLKPVSNTFHGRDIFAPVCAYVSRGEDIQKFGKTIGSFKGLELPRVKVSSQELVGEIIYIDRFGNLVSNIEKQTLEGFIKNKRFKICIADKTIEKLASNYAEGSPHEPIALIDSFNYLEIALNCSRAADYLGVNIGSHLKIKL